MVRVYHLLNLWPVPQQQQKYHNTDRYRGEIHGLSEFQFGNGPFIVRTSEYSLITFQFIPSVFPLSFYTKIDLRDRPMNLIMLVLFK
jgi:hypothetical protein